MKETIGKLLTKQSLKDKERSDELVFDLLKEKLKKSTRDVGTQTESIFLTLQSGSYIMFINDRLV